LNCGLSGPRSSGEEGSGGLSQRANCDPGREHRSATACRITVIMDICGSTATASAEAAAAATLPLARLLAPDEKPEGLGDIIPR
jgi:hypothetical protein